MKKVFLAILYNKAISKLSYQGVGYQVAGCQLTELSDRRSISKTGSPDSKAIGQNYYQEAGCQAAELLDSRSISKLFYNRLPDSSQAISQQGHQAM